ncbi:MAG: hypothetical protein HY688_01975, partial [Chloroflexi bacterium]|nr:hypothetical protein [Chloroflexota bacterium]
MRRSQWIGLLVIGVLFVGSAWSIAVPRWRFSLLGSTFERGSRETPMGLRLGLDLQGGVHLVYETEDPHPSQEALEGTIRVIRRRVDAFGVTEPLIQTLGENRVLVQLPGIRDVQAAKDLIGAPAKLDFRELVVVQPTPQASPVAAPPAPPAAGAASTPAPTSTAAPISITLDWEVAKAQVEGREVELTGERLVPNSAQVDFDPQTGRPEVRLQFDREGGLAFEEITKRLVQFPNEDPRRRLGIFLDDAAISTPVVQAVIPGGRGVITGLSLEEAQVLAIQLNAGAFPTALKKQPILERDVDPFLGAGALDKGLR